MSLDDDVSEVTLVAKASNYEVKVPRDIVIISGFISATIAQDAVADRFEFDELDQVVLDQIVEYMKHHNGKEPAIIEIPLKSDVMSEVVSDQWDATFIDGIVGAEKDLNRIYALVRGALLLQVNSLLHLACAKIASLIKGKTIEESRTILTAK